MSHVKRNTATDRSFVEQNRQYLHHPRSSVLSQKFHKTDKGFLKQLEDARSTIKQEILAEIVDSSHQFSQTYSSQPTSQIAFLTKDELNEANENAKKRYAEILDSDPVPSLIRPDISKTESNDSGLAWLYESPITFIDSSEDVSDQVCLQILI